MTRLAPIAVLAATTLLTACGGSGGSGVVTSNGSPVTGPLLPEELPVTGPLTLQDLNDTALNIFNVENSFREGTLRERSEDALIALGSARYEGLLSADFLLSDDDRFATRTEAAFIGRTNIDVTFADGGSLTGSVTDFVTVRDTLERRVAMEGDTVVFDPFPEDTALTPVAGSLTLTGGALRTVSNFGVLDIDVAGSITVPESISATNADATFTVDGALFGTVTEDDQFRAEGLIDAVEGDTRFRVFVESFAD